MVTDSHLMVDVRGGRIGLRWVTSTAGNRNEFPQPVAITISKWTISTLQTRTYVIFFTITSNIS
jgi:hypothetical protein